MNILTERDQARLWSATTVIIEDKASGTQLIQELVYEGMHGIKRYEPPPGQDKIMRMHSCSAQLRTALFTCRTTRSGLQNICMNSRYFLKAKIMTR